MCQINATTTPPRSSLRWWKSNSLSFICRCFPNDLGKTVLSFSRKKKKYYPPVQEHLLVRITTYSITHKDILSQIQWIERFHLISLSLWTKKKWKYVIKSNHTDDGVSRKSFIFWNIFSKVLKGWRKVVLLFVCDIKGTTKSQEKKQSVKNTNEYTIKNKTYLFLRGKWNICWH